MARRTPKLTSLLIAAALTLAASGFAQKPDGMSMTTSLPGTGYGVNEEGVIDPGGATQLNIPIGYTLSGGQLGLSLWAGDAGGAGANLQGGLSLGMFERGAGLSATLVGTDTSNPVTGHVQKQLQKETTEFPAISAGILDLGDYFERSYYLAATKRIGKAPQLKQTFITAALPAWPAWPRRPSAYWPGSWGVMVLPGSTPDDADKVSARNELLVSRSDTLPVLDGMLGEEWQDAAQVKLLLPRGEQFLLGAKQVGQTLYIAVGVPSDRPMAAGARVDLYFEAPRVGSRILDDQHRRFRLEWVGGKNPTKLYAATVARGRWAEGPGVTGAALRQQAVTGCAGDAGDGVWRYPVFEFAIPVEQLGVEPGERLGFGVAATLPRLVSRQPLVARDRGVEYLRWPVPLKPERVPSTEAFRRSPDFWGEVAFRGKSSGKELISAPEVSTIPALDGEISEGEWAGADKRTITSATGASHTLYAQRTNEAVYVAVVAGALDGPRRDQGLAVYLDPMGDAGICPRKDDRLLKVSQSDKGVKVEVQAWNEAAKRWLSAKENLCEVAVKPGEMLLGTKTVAEIEIPLLSLRYAQAPGSEQKMGLGLETELTPAPPKTVMRPKVQSGAGDATFVTVAWGSGVYHHRALYGVSHPIGAFRAMAEYDGDQVNVGLSGGLFGSDKVRLTVGWNGLNETRDSGPLVGTAFTTSF